MECLGGWLESRRLPLGSAAMFTCTATGSSHILPVRPPNGGFAGVMRGLASRRHARCCGGGPVVATRAPRLTGLRPRTASFWAHGRAPACAAAEHRRRRPQRRGPPRQAHKGTRMLTPRDAATPRHPHTCACGGPGGARDMKARRGSALQKRLAMRCWARTLR